MCLLVYKGFRLRLFHPPKLSVTAVVFTKAVAYAGYSPILSEANISLHPPSLQLRQILCTQYFKLFF